MLILLPPSEGKASPERGPRLDVDSLSFPALTPTRERILGALVDLCQAHPHRAIRVLSLGPTQANEIATDAALRVSPCAPAIEVYTGVLYDALDWSTLDATARRHGRSRIAIASALWGLVRPQDLIPSYRLSASVALPPLGRLPGIWRPDVSEAIGSTRGLIVDLRSSAYVALGPVPTSAGSRAVTVRVLHEKDGHRTVVSHHNKTTKGRLVRTLLQRADAPTSPSELVGRLRDEGHAVEQSPGRAQDTVLDVVVSQL